MLTDDIYGRIEKSIFKISQSKNQSSIAKKIEEFNAGVREYNELMEQLLQTIKNESNNISEVQERNNEKVIELLDKYDEILNNTKRAIQNNTLSNLPTVDKIVADTLEDVTLETEEIDYRNLANDIKNELENHSNPFDDKNNYYEPFVIKSDIEKMRDNVINSSYDFSNNYIARIRKNANVKAIEFGFSISQFNLSHFNNTEFDESGNYIGEKDNENIIHRYYRGILFFSDVFDMENYKVRAKLLLPDRDPLGLDNVSIGPEINLKYAMDNEYIYIAIDSFTPYILDWKFNEELGKYEFFDMYSDDHINNSKVHFIIDGYFDDLTRRTEEVLKVAKYNITFAVSSFNKNNSIVLKYMYQYINHNSYIYKNEASINDDEDDDNSNLNPISSYIASSLTLKPSKEGFLKYVNFDFTKKNNKEDITKTKELMFYTHSLSSNIKDSDFSSYYSSSINDIINYIKDTFLLEDEEVKVKSLDIIKNILYLNTNFGLFAKDYDTNKIFEADGFDEENHLTDESEIKIYGVGYDSNSNSKLMLTNIGIFGEVENNKFYIPEEYEVTENDIFDNIIEGKFIPPLNSFCLYTNKGIILVKKSVSVFDYRYIYYFTQNDDLRENNSSTRIFFNKDYLYFACNNAVIVLDYNDLDNPKFVNIVDKINFPSSVIYSIYHDYYTDNDQILFKDTVNNTFKVLTNLFKENSFIIKELENELYSQFGDYDFYIFNHPFTNEVIFIGINDEKSIVSKLTPSSLFKQGYTPFVTEFTDITYSNEKEYISIDYDSGNFVFFSNDSIILCKANGYKRNLSLTELKHNILNYLEVEKEIRSEKLGFDVDVPYRLEICGTSPNKLPSNINLEKVYTEFGSFNKYKTEDFEFHNTNSTLFAINKNDRRIVYISSSDLNRFEEIPRNEKLYEMNLVYFPMGFERLVDYNLDSECEYFIGSDKEVYQFGAYYPEVDSKNYLSKPRKIEFDHDERFDTVIVIKDKVYAFDNETRRINIKNAKNVDNKQKIVELQNEYIKVSFFVSTKGIIIYDSFDKTFSEYEYLDISDNSLISNTLEVPSEFGVGTLNKFFIEKDKDVIEFEPKTNTFNSEVMIPIDYISELIPFVYKTPDEYDPENIVYNRGYDSLIVRVNSKYYLVKYIDNEFTYKQICGGYTIVENNIYSVIFKSSYGDLYNLGVSNGYHSSFRYTDEDSIHEIPNKTTYLGNERIERVFIDTNKTYLITESGKLFASGSRNNKISNPDDDPRLGFKYDYESKNYFEELKDLEFEPKDIKKIVFDIYNTFILVNNGDLYCCGKDDYGNMGINSDTGVTKEFEEFELINRNVNNIWGNYGREIIEKIEDSKKVYYAAGDNEYGKLGALNNKEYREWTKIKLIPDYAPEEIKEIYFFKDNTYALSTTGTVYVSGRNNYGQLGVDSYSHVYEFRLSTSCNNVEKIYSNKNSDLVAYIDYSGNLYFAGNKFGTLYRTFTKENIDKYVTEICISDSGAVFITWEDRINDTTGCRYYESDGTMHDIDFEFARVRKIVADKDDNFYFIHSGIKLLSRATIVEENEEKKLEIYTYYEKVESNSTTSGYNCYSDLISIPNTSVIKFVNSENHIGAVFLDKHDLEHDGYGTGFGLVTGTENVNNYGKMYLGVSNFDQDKEVNSICQYFDYESKEEIKSNITGKMLDVFDNIFKNLIVSAKLSIYPFIPVKNKLEVEIPKQTEEKTTINLVGTLS